jgi:hypothetical protein
MLNLTNPADDRIRDLHATAAALRNERILASRKGSRDAPGLRVRVGRALMAAGATLVNGASPAAASRAGR